MFMDTSAVFAIADSTDPNHRRASERLQAALIRREPILTHNYVVLESAALMQRRLGLEATLTFLKGVHFFHVHWVTQSQHEAAVELLVQRDRRGLSLVDCVSFVVMRELGIGTAFAYDADFEREGFVTA